LVYNTALNPRTDCGGKLSDEQMVCAQQRPGDQQRGERGVRGLSVGNAPRPTILNILINGDTSVTLTYSTTPGFPYHVKQRPI